MTIERNKPSLLDPQGIISALERIVDPKSVKRAAIISIIEAGANARINLTIRGTLILSASQAHATAERGAVALCSQTDRLSKLYVLCNLYAPNSEPWPEGTAKDIDRAMETLERMYSCLIHVFEYQEEVFDFFLQNPDRLCLGMIRNEKIVLLPGASKGALTMYKMRKSHKSS